MKHFNPFSNPILLGLVLLIFFQATSADAAIAFRQKTFAYQWVYTTSTTLTEPTGTAQNDILFLWGLWDGNPSVTTPTGWTLLYTVTGTVTKCALFWIRRGASAPSLTINYANTVYTEFSLTAWSGAETSGSPIHVSAAAPATNAAPPYPNPPSVTTTVANTMIIAFGMTWAGWDPMASAPSGFTIREGGVNGSNNDIAVASKAKAATGAEDPGTFTPTLNPGNTTNWAAVTVALMEPGASAPKPIRHRVINQ